MKKIVLFLMAICTATVLINAQTSGPVDFYGELQVSGNKLVGSKTNETPVQVKGVSLGWSNSGWESSHYFNANAVNAMVDLWKAEIIRVPIGYSEGGGYKSDASNITRVKAAVDAAIAKGVYVIIDWHSHSAHNEEDAAKQYFAEMAEEYGENDHVIFEIYNEPLEETSWSVIKTYANTIITEIRKHSDNLILVGTRSWSQLVSEPKNNKIDDANTAYVLHFYASQHTLDSYTSGGATFRNETISALDNDLAVFVSEYGTVDANGNGDHSDEKSNKWHDFLDTHKISSCAWQLSYKNEGSAFFTKNFEQSVSENFIKPENLKATGLYLYDKLSEWAEVAPWRNSKPCTNVHKITYLTGNDATTIAEGSVCDGEFAVKPKKDPVRAGYEFIGWLHNATLYNFQTPVTADLTLTAQWQACTQIAITFESNNIIVKTIEICKGTKVEKPENPGNPPNSSEVFVGWETENGILFDFKSAVLENTTLIARWAEPLPYQIAFTFENDDIDKAYPSSSWNDSPNMLVKENPKSSDGNARALKFTPQNWNTAVEFNVVLPVGKTWEDVSGVSIDVYTAAAGTNDANLNKNFEIGINTHKAGTTTTHENDQIPIAEAGKWKTTFIPASSFGSVTAGNSFKLHLGVNYNEDVYYFDNIKVVVPFKIVLNANSREVVNALIQVNPGEALPTLPIPTHSNVSYEFLGWYSDNTTFTNQYFGNEIVQQDITLYAKWKHTHDFSKKNTDVAPTCSSKGEGHYSCPICGAIGDSYEIAELEHNYIWIVDPNNADREIEVCADCREESGNTREREETGVEELHEKTIFAYPNPTTGVVYLSEQSNVQLFNNLGQLLFKGNVQSLDISGFERGIYVLRVGETSIQIIKE